MQNVLGAFTVKSCAMDDDMSSFAAETAIQANNSFHEQEMATFMKNKFQNKYPSSYWHCIVGK